MNNHRGQLTRHPEGSIQELWAISFPLMLSVLSISMMTFVDRLMLSKYDIRAMNAAVVAGFVFNVFQYGAIGIAAITEVFVGQFNGAKEYRRMGESVWQMIWFSLMTSVVFIPLALFGGAILIPNPEYIKDGIPFFRWLMIFGPAFPLVTTLSSFFIGRGQVKPVMVSTILSNLLNVILDFILIFGVGEIIPAMGASGAAIATGASQVVQVVILFTIFLSPQYKEIYGTHGWIFKPKVFIQAVKIGLPTALSSVIELTAWSFLSQILTTVSEAHITIFSIGDSFFNLFAFGFWGLQKGITTVAANYLGANRDEIVGLCLRSGIKIIIGLMLLFTVPLLLFPEILVQQFLTPEDSLLNEDLISYAVIATRWLWFYFLLDAIAWLFWGVLTAGGDTKFVMMRSGISVWCFAIVPTYFMVTYMDGSPIVVWVLCTLYAALNTISYFLRYRSKRWNSSSRIREFCASNY
jgi:MATE family multidrug resistance protein